MSTFKTDLQRAAEWVEHTRRTGYVQLYREALAEYQRIKEIRSDLMSKGVEEVNFDLRG